MMKLDTNECSFRDNIELNPVTTEAILSLGSKILVDVQTLDFSLHHLTTAISSLGSEVGFDPLHPRRTLR